MRIKREKTNWGARKIRELLIKRLAGDVRVPAKSTVHAVLDRYGLVTRARTRRNKANGTPLSQPLQPNALWCADFKGEFNSSFRRAFTWDIRRYEPIAALARLSLSRNR